MAIKKKKLALKQAPPIIAFFVKNRLESWRFLNVLLFFSPPLK